MTKLRINAPVEQATPLLERYAQLAHERAMAEASRGEAIAVANGVADKILLPIVEEMDCIRVQLEPWWQRTGVALLTGKRKSIELGGCVIGSKAGSASLKFAGGDDKAAAAALQAHRWAKPYVRVTYAPDKAAIGAALGGKHGDQLKALGFTKPAAPEAFILDRAEQGGTVTAA